MNKFLMKFQDLYLQSFKRLAQRNLEKMGEKTGLVLSPFSPPAASDETHKRERPGFVLGWRQRCQEGVGAEKVPPPLYPRKCRRLPHSWSPS